jgi:hypothetical protein
MMSQREARRQAARRAEARRLAGDKIAGAISRTSLTEARRQPGRADPTLKRLCSGEIV